MRLVEPSLVALVGKRWKPFVSHGRYCDKFPATRSRRLQPASAGPAGPGRERSLSALLASKRNPVRSCSLLDRENGGG